MHDNPFDLNQRAAYERWRDTKRASHPRRAEDLVVDVADPRKLSDAERNRLLALCAAANMAIYRSPVVDAEKAIPRLLGAQLGLHRLDANWLADEDGISRIAVSQQAGARSDFIPYTNRPIQWHTDGYYHPQERRICGMVLHCVRSAVQGGDNRLADHERVYIALRDANPDWVAALMQPDAMTIPAREDADGVARPAQSGPVFALLHDANQGVCLHMRYTARTRSIVWKDDAPTRAAVAFLATLLASDAPWLYQLRLQPGMGVVANNVLHTRSGFSDDPQQPRLLYRARYLDRMADAQEAPDPPRVPRRTVVEHSL